MELPWVKEVVPEMVRLGGAT